MPETKKIDFGHFDQQQAEGSPVEVKVGTQPEVAQTQPITAKDQRIREIDAWARQKNEIKDKLQQTDASEDEIEELQKQIAEKNEAKGQEDASRAEQYQIQTDIDELQKQIAAKEQQIDTINDEIAASYQQEHPEDKPQNDAHSFQPQNAKPQEAVVSMPESKAENSALTKINYYIQERRNLLDKLKIFDSLPEDQRGEQAAETESEIRQYESEIAKLWGEGKDDIKDKLPTWALTDLAEITAEPDLKKKAEGLTVITREMEPKELHKNVKKLVDQLATDSFDAFKVRKLEEKYGKGWFGKVKAFFGGEYDYNINPDDPDKKTRSDNFKVLMRIGRKVITDKKLLTAGAITAALGILTGGFGAVGIGIATSKVLWGTGIGRLSAEFRAEIAGEEGKAREQLLRAELEHFNEMNAIAQKLNKAEHANDSERNALVKQLVDIYYEADGSGATAALKESREGVSVANEKWDKVRNKWTNIGAIAGAGVGILQNFQWLSDVAHRVDLSGDGVRHAVQRVGDGYQHIYGQAFTDQYGALHAPVAGETIGKAGEIGHKLLETNQQVYWAMIKSVAPNLLKTSAVLAGALLPRIETKYKPTEFGLEGQFSKRAFLHEPTPPPTPGAPSEPGPGESETKKVAEETSKEVEGIPSTESIAETPKTRQEVLEMLKDEYNFEPKMSVKFVVEQDKIPTEYLRDHSWLKPGINYKFENISKNGKKIFLSWEESGETHHEDYELDKLIAMKDKKIVRFIEIKAVQAQKAELTGAVKKK